MTYPLPPCRRCLQDGADRQQIEKTIQNYLEALPAEELSSTALYSKRLSFCDACEHLSNGLCTLCGCFVLYRAGRCTAHCPDTTPKW